MKIRTKLIILTSGLVIQSILPISLMVSKYTREGIVKETNDVCKNLSRLISSFATEELILNSTFESTTKIVNELKENKINGLLNLYILNISGKYVVAMDSALVGLNVSTEELDFFRKIDELTLREKEIQNKSILQFSYPILIESDNEKLKVGLAVFEFDKRELFLPVQKIQELILYITLASILLGVVVSLVASGLFSKPIQELLKGIRIISSGNLEHTIEYKSSDEIGVLATEFNMMTSKIRESNFELKNLNEDLQTLTHTLEVKISDGVREKQKYNSCLLELNKSKRIEIYGIESALEELTEICARILEVGRCSVWKLNQRGDELICLDLFNLKENKHENVLSFNVSDFPKYFHYFKSEDILSAANVYSHPGIEEFNENYHKLFNIESALDAPIRSGGRTLGIISCEQIFEKKEWTSEEENFVSAVSNILASYFESNERQEAYKELSETKKEIEDLNQFTHLVNSLSTLNEIFMEVSKYTYSNFSIVSTWLFLPDEKREYLYSYKGYSYNKLPENKFRNMLNKKLSLKRDEGGILYKIFDRKKLLYLRKLPKIKSEIDRELTDNLSLKSLLYLPLIRKGECVGIFCFSNFEQPMKLSNLDIQKINNRCSQIAGAVDTHYLLEQVVKARIELNNSLNIIREDLLLARKIQKNILLANRTDLDELKIISTYIPMSEVGGDFYDITKINESCYRIFLADATGHGVQAAMITMAIKGLYDNIKNYDLEISQILETFNNQFIEKYSNLKTYLTCLMADIDIKNNCIEIASAGHPAGILIHSNQITNLPKTGRMIGIFKNPNYKCLKYEFLRGDRIYLFTDGIFEEFNEDQEEFGEERLHSLLLNLRNSSIEKSIEHVLNELDHFLKGKDKQDDITILGIEYKDS